MPTIHGTFFDDTLFADQGNQVENDPVFSIFGHEGNDDLFGASNDDFIDGGTGADFMVGGFGDDTYVVDNTGDSVHELDTLGTANDTVFSSISFTLPDLVENLSLLSNAGAVNGTGNELANVIHGTESNNTLDGGDGADLLIGHGGSDTLRGGNQNDELFGSEQNDTLEGGGHDDQLDGGTGADTMRGGSGNDYYHVDNTGDVVTENANEGLDVVYSTVTFTLGGNVEDLVLLSGFGALDGTGNAVANMIAGNGSDNELRGNDGEDLLKGGGGADVLRGGNQNDELYGEGGDDDLRGDGGDDEMSGGADNDTYSVNSAGDLVIESANQGTDTVNSSLAAYTLTSNVENLTLGTGTSGTGNALVNVITGNILDNMLDGAGGADTMTGRQGADTYIVDNVNDAVVELTDQGNDTVLASVSYTLAAGVSVETLATTNDAGTAAINLTGNASNNSIRGNDADNILNGGGLGSDGLNGRGGSDTASYESNPWRVIVILGSNGAAGQGFEYFLVPQEVLVSVDTLINIERVRGSNFDDTLIGNEAQNQLRGNDGNDTLNGAGGSDTLIGGFGNDTYVVDNAFEVITEFGGQGNDTAQSSVSYTLTTGADVETLRTTDDNGTAAINLTGNAANNQVVGNNGDNTLNGGGGTGDQLTGRGGNDTYVVNVAGVTVTENGGQGIDTVRSSVTYTLTAGADVEQVRTNDDNGTAAINLTGNASGNVVTGNNGNNVLNGGDGRDDLVGRGGQDQFLFNTAPNGATNHDRILDFNVADDTILLDDAVFAGLAVGGLAAGQFVLGTAALDANDRVIYNSATGALLYDSDGTGGTAAIQFASASPGLGLTALDFLIV